MKTINHHLIANSKGGCGKSTTAMLLAWYYQEKRLETTNFDYDFACGSFRLFKSLNISPLILRGEGCSDENFAKWSKALEEATHDTITDYNVESFENVKYQILEYNLFERLTTEKKHKIYLHMPFTGGADVQPCINGFNRISGIFENQVNYICWLHKYHGEIDRDMFLKFYQENSHKIKAVVDLPRDSDYNKDAMGKMLMRNYSFTDILNSTEPRHQQLISQTTYMALKKEYYNAIEKNNLAELLQLV